MVEKASINLQRLLDTLQISASIGSLQNGGICRLALSKEDKQMRDIFVQWLEEENLQVKIDDLGNIYGRREGINPDASPVFVGSHLDTQPNGGRYDGILGVLCALEVIRTLNDLNVATYRPIVIANFTNEEGARFQPPMLGSGVIANQFEREFIYSREDSQGKTFYDCLKEIGYLGDKENRPKDIHSFVELHIEQGPILEKEGISIGAVLGIQGMTWLEVEVVGHEDHAGTTPMNMRRDALLSVAKMITAIQKITKATDEYAMATVGRLTVEPNSINCIPGLVKFSVDVRHHDDSVRNKLVEIITSELSTIAVADGMHINLRQIWDINATSFSQKIVDMIVKWAKQRNYSVKKMISGAGHDAKYMNHLAPTAMIFVPSKEGKSHCPEEYTSPEDIEKGANVLLSVVTELANMQGQI